MEMTPIAHIETDLPQKFGIPRNSFLAPHLQGRIVFEPEFALPQAVAGLEEFSHLWLLWEFENGTPGGTAADIAMDAATASKPGTTAKWAPTVRPPRLGGSERRGVFATRSPFRPNPIGLTCVKLDRIEIVDGAPVIHVLAADLRDGTPIFDIKPYIPFADSHPEATAVGSTARLGRSSRSISPPSCARSFPRPNSQASSRCCARTRAAPAASTSPSACIIWPTRGSTWRSPSTASFCAWLTSRKGGEGAP